MSPETARIAPPPPNAAEAAPEPLPIELALPIGPPVVAYDDGYSDRLRCDHPSTQADARALGEALIEAASTRRRGRVVVLAPASLEAGLSAAGLTTEATIPGFYRGEEACTVAGYWLDDERAVSPAEARVSEVLELVEARRGEPPRPRPMISTERATIEDAPGIAALLERTFDDYPTPSDDPAYVAQCIDEGTPFRVVREGGAVVACASADRVVEARTAELTDCATRPDQRGRGLMQALLGDLMHDLREMDYPTAFTLARARIPGVNLAFQRLGFDLHGTMVQSCRIGEGLEDMNVWSRRL